MNSARYVTSFPSADGLQQVPRPRPIDLNLNGKRLTAEVIDQFGGVLSDYAKLALKIDEPLPLDEKAQDNDYYRKLFENCPHLFPDGCFDNLLAYSGDETYNSLDDTIVYHFLVLKRNGDLELSTEFEREGRLVHVNPPRVIVQDVIHLSGNYFQTSDRKFHCVYFNYAGYLIKSLQLPFHIKKFFCWVSSAIILTSDDEVYALCPSTADLPKFFNSCNRLNTPAEIVNPEKYTVEIIYFNVPDVDDQLPQLLRLSQLSGKVRDITANGDVIILAYNDHHIKLIGKSDLDLDRIKGLRFSKGVPVVVDEDGILGIIMTRDSQVVWFKRTGRGYDF